MSSEAFSIGSIVVYKYSICILIAFVLGYFLAVIEAKRHKISANFVSDFLFYLIPICIIGARTYYVVFEFEEYKNSLLEIFMVWKGGLAIHGGILFGLVFLLFYTKKHKVNSLKFMDIAAVSLVIGQAIGRWGNFFNQEAYGPKTSLEFLESIHIPNFIIENMYKNGVYYQPTFLYESLGCLIIFIILLIIRRMKFAKNGTVCSFYLIGYGIIRFLIESLRQDSLMFFNIKVAQLVSILFIIAGIILLIYSQKREEKYNLETKKM